MNLTTPSSSPADPRRVFFAVMRERFERARERDGASEVDLRIAGRPVRIRFAKGPLADRLTPALAHLIHSTGRAAPSPELAISVWDSASTGVSAEPAPRALLEEATRGACDAEPAHLVSWWLYVDHCVLSMFDVVSRQAMFWLRDAADLPGWEAAAPFRQIWHWWARSFGGQLAHAAAVGLAGDGVLLVGKGGSGKSTSALACVQEGFQYVGDDYVLLTDDGAPAAHSLYNSAKLHTEFLQRALPGWDEHVRDVVGPERKSVLALDTAAADRLVDRLRIRAVMQPCVTGRPCTRLIPIRRSQCLLAAVPSTVYQLPDAHTATLQFFERFTRGLPAHRLEVGTDLATIPRALADYLTKEPCRVA